MRKTHGRNEDAVKKVRGTVWIDESARQVRRMQATFDEPLRIGFRSFRHRGMPASNFFFEQALIRNESLATHQRGRAIRRPALFVGFHVELSMRFDQYRKIRRQREQSILRCPKR